MSSVLDLGLRGVFASTGIWLCLMCAGTGVSRQPPGGVRALWHTPVGSVSFGGGAAADVDGDGLLEVAFATYFNDGTVYVLRGKDGAKLWSYKDKLEHENNCLDASLKFADLDGDGKLELIVPGSSSCSVMCFEAAKGDLRWRADTGLERGECIDTPPFVGDVDADGKPEVVVGTFKGKFHVIKHDGKISREVKIAPGAVQSCPIVMDLNGDGAADFVGGNFHGDHALHAIDGKTQAELWKVQTGDHIYHGPAVGDIDGDGEPDMAFGSYDGKVYAFRAKDGKSLWTIAPGDHYFMAPAVIADVDGDGKNEVIVTSSHVTAIKRDGTVLWRVPVDPNDSMAQCTRGVSVADVDGDGKPEAVFAGNNGVFRAVRGRDGKEVHRFDAGTLTDKKITAGDSGVVLADLNGDGMLEAFFVVGGWKKEPIDPSRPNNDDRFGLAVCLTGFAGKASHTNGWYMFRHDHGNTGNAATALSPAFVKCVPIKP